MNTPPDPKKADTLERLARRLTSDNTPMGELARLRRMDPEHPEAALGLMRDLLGEKALYAPTEHLQRWALIIHSLALARGRHRNQAQTFGKAMVEIHFGELRLQQLLRADLPVLFDLLPRVARRLAAHATEANWWPIAHLVLNTHPSAHDLQRQNHRPANSIDSTVAEAARLEIARDFVIANESVREH